MVARFLFIRDELMHNRTESPVQQAPNPYATNVLANPISFSRELYRRSILAENRDISGAKPVGLTRLGMIVSEHSEPCVRPPTSLSLSRSAEGDGNGRSRFGPELLS